MAKDDSSSMSMPLFNLKVLSDLIEVSFVFNDSMQSVYDSNCIDAVA